MRLARQLVPVALLAVAVTGGCGSSDSTQSTGPEYPRAPGGPSAQSCPIDAGGIQGLRVTAVRCGEGQKVAIAWSRDAACSSPPEASRFGCTVRGYRCLGTATERGISVSCARPQRSIAFIARSG